ncbi:MAG: type II toxin-antitoxin system prevent-host-death family antitoxin [Candidatus Nealsonbacteria bacterium]|nr:type II toxin-antitoxin system prevent-host-death family antitoxin [Candidatus Nealsonbacteria bacterium]
MKDKDKSIVIPATKARKRFQEIIDKVHYQEESIVITKHRKPWIVIDPLPEEEKEKILEGKENKGS